MSDDLEGYGRAWRAQQAPPPDVPVDLFVDPDHRRRWVAAGAGLAAAASIVTGVLLSTSGGGSTSSQLRVTAAPPTDVHPISETRDVIASLSFDSPTHGWFLFSDTDCSPCPKQLSETRDGGRTFLTLPAPSTDVTGIRFATDHTGWSFPTLRVTHDGGITWSAAAAGAPATVDDLEIAGGAVWALSGRQLWTSAVGHDAWRLVTTLPAAATAPTLTAHGRTAWVGWTDGAGGHVLTTTGSSTRTADLPCDGDRLPLGAASEQVVWTVCTGLGQQRPVLQSVDGGATWRVTASGPFTAVSPALGSSTSALFSSLSGAHRTDDAGVTSDEVTPLGATQAAFLDATHAVAWSGSELYTSDDAGHTWSQHQPSAIGSGPAGHRCTLGDLSVVVGPSLAAAGNVGVPVILRNVSLSSCWVQGYVGLQDLDAQGREIPTHPTRGPGMLFADPGPHRIALTPGQSASAGVGWGDAVTCPTSTPSLHFELTPPDEVRNVVLDGGVGDCSGNLYTTALVAGVTGRVGP